MHALFSAAEAAQVALLFAQGDSGRPLRIHVATVSQVAAAPNGFVPHRPVRGDAELPWEQQAGGTGWLLLLPQTPEPRTKSMRKEQK